MKFQSKLSDTHTKVMQGNQMISWENGTMSAAMDETNERKCWYLTRERVDENSIQVWYVADIFLADLNNNKLKVGTRSFDSPDSSCKRISTTDSEASPAQSRNICTIPIYLGPEQLSALGYWYCEHGHNATARTEYTVHKLLFVLHWRMWYHIPIPYWVWEPYVHSLLFRRLQ